MIHKTISKLILSTRNRVLLLVALPVSLLLGTAMPANAAKDFNVLSGGQSLLFIKATTGNMGIGTTTPVAHLQVGSGTPNLGADLSVSSVLIKGNLEVDGKIYGDGSLLSGVATTAGLTQNYMTKMGAGTLANSVLYDDNSNVGIGTTSPQAKLEVDGTLYVNGNVGIGTHLPQAKMHVVATAGQMRVGYDATNYAAYSVDNAGRLTINTRGTSYTQSFQRNGVRHIYLSSSPYVQLGNDISVSSNSDHTIMKVYGNITSTATTGTSLSLDSNFGPTSPSTMIAQGMIIEPTIDYSAGGTGHYEALRINVTETALPDGPNYLFRAGTGGATFSSKFDILNNGNVGIGTYLPATLLQIGTTTPAIPAGSSPVEAIKGNLVVDGQIYGDGSRLTGVASTSGLTQNYVTKMGASSLVDSTIYDTGANLGIGTIAPNAMLELQQTGTTPPLMVSSSGATDGDYFIIASNGNIGIGSAAPAAPLDILPAQNGTTAAITFFRQAGSGMRPRLRIYGYGDAVAGQHYGEIYIDTYGRLSFDADLSIYTPRPLNVASLINFPGTQRDSLGWSSTNHAAFIGLGTYLPSNDGRNLIIADTGATSFNFGHPVNLEPTVYLHSSQQSQTQYLSLTHNQDNGVIATGAGNLILSPAANVGIGTTAPNASLELQQTGTTAPLMVSSSDTADGDFLIVTSDGNVGVGTSAPQARLQVDGNVYLGGNIGIGSATPEASLAVQGTTIIRGAVEIDLQ